MKNKLNNIYLCVKAPLMDTSDETSMEDEGRGDASPT